jgi:group I intron endonuclease
MGIIYKITNPKGNIYIGQTIDLEKRKKRYGWMTSGKQRKLHNSFLKYGFDAHVFEILEDRIPVELLNEREIYWIKLHKSYYKDSKNGMNLNRGGNTPVWDKERIDNFSEKFRGDKNPFFGKTHSKETRELYSRNATIQMKTQKPTRLAIEKGAASKMRAIVVYDRSGKFYSEFPSLTSTAKNFEVDVTTIRDVLRNNGWLKKSYTCRYINGEYPLNIAV